MDGYYEVIHENMPVGKVELRRQGLYWGITCRCQIPDGEMYRLVAAWTEGWKNLGIPVPDSDGFILKKNLPVKQLGEDNLRFVLMKLSQNPEDLLFPETQSDVPPEESKATEDVPPISESGEENIPSQKSEDTVPIMEDEPFERLHEIVNAKIEIRDEGPVAVFERGNSDIQRESDGTMIGSQDVCVDGSSDDSVTDTV